MDRITEKKIIKKEDKKTGVIEYCMILSRILVPIAIHFLIADIVRETLCIRLQKQEVIHGMEQLNERFAASGMGVWSVCITSAITIPIFGLMFYSDRKAGHIQGNTRYEGNAVVQLLLVIPFAICTALGLNQLINLSKIAAFFKGEDEAQMALLAGSLALRLVTVGILVPLSEELMFRGLVMGRIRSRRGIRSAVVISAVLFGLYHLNFIQLLYATAVGIILAKLYYVTGHLIFPIVFHGVANVFIILAEDWIFLKGPVPELISCIIGITGMIFFCWLYFISLEKTPTSIGGE